MQYGTSLLNLCTHVMWLRKTLYISLHACAKAPLKAGSFSTTSFSKAGLHEPFSFHPLSINFHMGLLYIVVPPPEFLHPGDVSPQRLKYWVLLVVGRALSEPTPQPDPSVSVCLFVISLSHCHFQTQTALAEGLLFVSFLGAGNFFAIFSLTEWDLALGALFPLFQSSS